MITVFTPTYNRGYILGVLFQSLLLQVGVDFEWLVVDDGSTDGTADLVAGWVATRPPFPIRYHQVANGGKARAINLALSLASGEIFFIVDSDDSLPPGALARIQDWFGAIQGRRDLAGVSGLRGDRNGHYVHSPPGIDPAVGFVEASNLERARYGLQHDMAEAFWTDVLRRYPFPVWPGETFTPEAVVWDAMARDGLRMRWHNAVVYHCHYQPDGLMASTWKLLKANPMGYAMLFNAAMARPQGLRSRMAHALQCATCCCLAREYGYLGRTHRPGLTLALLPAGWLLALRRRWQFRKHGV